MKTFKIPAMARKTALGLALAMFLGGAAGLFGQSLDIPAKTWGISFGNSPEFTGLRFNFRDNKVVRVTGVNITFWQPCKENQDSIIQGVSLGVIPGGGDMGEIQIGLLGVAAQKTASGLTIGGLGVGAGTTLVGVNIGGLGVGAGTDMTGINIGGLGLGAGNNLTGLSFGGLGVGAGGNLAGISVGGLGVGAGGSAVGINVGGVGAGAGDDMAGLNIAGVGLGAGKRLIGINIAGVAAGAGERLAGLTICGIAAGGKEVAGLTIGGFAVGGQILKGIHLAGGMVHVVKDGSLSGLAASPFNYIRGSQSGISIGIVNYAFHVNGVQVGLINIVRDNPRYLKVLPLFNTSF